MRIARFLRPGAMLVLVAAAGALGARAVAGGRAEAARSRAFAPPVSAATYDSATLEVRGRLSDAARARLASSSATSGGVLVLLDAADVRVCEDLGRQLRELRSRLGETVPFIIGAPAASLETIRAFAHREHLRPDGVVELRASDVIIRSGAGFRTPAALVLLGREGDVAGIAHSRRFRNVRVRSFAEELAAYLPDRHEPSLQP
jgi:hypothetical protein